VIRLADEVRARLLSWASDAAPREACGLLFGAVGPEDARVRRANLLDGQATVRRFTVPPAALLAHAGDPSWIGLWHSHPSGPNVLSPEDRAAFAAWPRLVHVLVLPPTGMRAFSCAVDGFAPAALVVGGDPGMVRSARP
jgi:proteasome lid subunit RPN8/RPN11